MCDTDILTINNFCIYNSGPINFVKLPQWIQVLQHLGQIKKLSATNKFPKETLNIEGTSQQTTTSDLKKSSFFVMYYFWLNNIKVWVEMIIKEAKMKVWRVKQLLLIFSLSLYHSEMQRITGIVGNLRILEFKANNNFLILTPQKIENK